MVRVQAGKGVCRKKMNARICVSRMEAGPLFANRAARLKQSGNRRTKCWAPVSREGFVSTAQYRGTVAALAQVTGGH